MFLFGFGHNEKNPVNVSCRIKISEINDIYNKLNDNSLSYEAFQFAVEGFIKLQQENKLKNDSLLTIIDYYKPSSEKRLFIIDLKNQRIIEKSLVAHGKKTGALYAKTFSNIPGSLKSSLGFFVTEQTYYGKHGYSLRIKGMEPGINSNASQRDIVFHGANYVSNTYINLYGRLGRSFGCPALPPDKNREIINLIKNRACVFVFYPSKKYLQQSSFIEAGWHLQQIAE